MTNHAYLVFSFFLFALTEEQSSSQRASAGSQRGLYSQKQKFPRAQRENMLKSIIIKAIIFVSIEMSCELWRPRDFEGLIRTQDLFK